MLHSVVVVHVHAIASCPVSLVSHELKGSLGVNCSIARSPRAFCVSCPHFPFGHFPVISPNHGRRHFDHRKPIPSSFDSKSPPSHVSHLPSRELLFRGRHIMVLLAQRGQFSHVHVHVRSAPAHAPSRLSPSCPVCSCLRPRPLPPSFY